MKIFEINECSCGSTGKIAISICQIVKENGGECVLAVANSRTNKRVGANDIIYIGSRVSRNINLLCTTLTGYNSILSIFSTRTLIKKIDDFNPDIIHLHNLHNSYLNLPILFKYIKQSNHKMVWTLHDCWSFTGQCPYFSMVKCDKWKSGCYECSQYNQYPKSLVDRTKTMWKLKKKWFTGIPNMQIVTPSQWLANLVKESFLKEYPIKVINNGINLSVFKPSKSNFRKEKKIQEKYIVLGVAFLWERRKGLDVFIKLSQKLGPNYKIVLVGTDEKIDELLPDNILSIHHTNNQNELAEIYTAADVFVNPTREENYPTVNMEALACGTPVITFDTGGSPEIVTHQTGIIIYNHSLEDMKNAIVKICESKCFTTDKCLVYSKEFDQNKKYIEYIELYKELLD